MFKRGFPCAPWPTSGFPVSDFPISGAGGKQTSSPFADPAYFFPERGGPELFNQDAAGYYIWDPNYFEVEGVHYLVYSRFLKTDGFADGWKISSEICYATASSRLGTYTFGGVLLAGEGGVAWDKQSVHNAKLYEFGGTWYLFYFGNFTTIGTQQIGVATASSINGTYTRSASPIIALGGAGTWDELSCTNPTVILGPDGTYRMLYKGINAAGTAIRIGLATASNPAGPWTKHASNPVINAFNCEDPSLWYEGGLYRVVAKDLTGTGGAGVVTVNDSFLMTSADAVTWGEPTNGYYGYRISDWGTGLIRAERPNVLLGPTGAKQYLMAATLTTASGKSALEMTDFIPGVPIQASADTYIKASTDNTKNYGSATTLSAGFASSMIQRALVNFDTSSIPANATITRAWFIWHYSAKTGSADPVLQFRPLTQAWVEGTGNGTSPGNAATWDTYNGVDAWPGGAGALADAPTLMGSVFVPNTDTFGRYSVPLTSLTLAGVANGFLIRNSNEGLTKLITFGARTNTKPGQRPMLVVEWTT